MNGRFYCSFTRDDLDLIIYALQEAAQTLIDQGGIYRWGNSKMRDISLSHARKLQSLAAVINNAVENTISTD